VRFVRGSAAFGVLLALSGCLRTDPAAVTVTVEKDGDAPPPEYLLFSWVKCGSYLRRNDRVPDAGTLARKTNPLASVVVQLTLTRAEKRGVLIKGMVGASTVSTGLAAVDIVPGQPSAVTVRLHAGAVPAVSEESLPQAAAWCGGGVTPPDAAEPDTRAPADAREPDAGRFDVPPSDLPPPADAAPADAPPAPDAPAPDAPALPDAAPPDTAPTVDLTRALVGLWRFDEGSGTTAADGSGGGNPATLASGAAWSPGRVGPSALDCRGTGSQAVIRDPASGRLDFAGDFTVAVWVRTTRATGTPDMAVKWPASGSSGPANGYALGLISGAPSFKALGAGTRVELTGTAAVNDGQWHHLAGRKTATRMDLFVDGRLAANRSHTLQSLVNDEPLEIGGWRAVSSHDVQGQVDQLTLHARALSDAEVAALAGDAGL
jgi:hypothetical protein